MARVPIPFFGGPNTVSFTRQPAAGVQTLDALMARQKELARRQADLSAGGYPGEGTIVGGLGNMANQLFAGIGQNRARQEEALGRQELAQAISGVNWDTGEAAPETVQTIFGRDPDTGLAVIQALAESRRAQREATALQRQREQERGWTVEDREDAQRATSDLAAARADQWEEVPAPEGAPAGTLWQRNRRTGETKATGGSGVNVQLMSPETGARVALGDEFLRNFDTVLASAKAGEMTGPIDYANAIVGGRGPGGAAYRMLKQGSEALVRQMTGAGMSGNEAAERAAQYEPQITDDADVLASKVEGLRNALEATRSGATFGRNAPPAPEATPDATGQVPEIAADDMEGYGRLPAGAKYKIPGDPTIYTKGAQ